jgi:hypothetical protein
VAASEIEELGYAALWFGEAQEREAFTNATREANAACLLREALNRGTAKAAPDKMAGPARPVWGGRTRPLREDTPYRPCIDTTHLFGGAHPSNGTFFPKGTRGQRLWRAKQEEPPVGPTNRISHVFER